MKDNEATTQRRYVPVRTSQSLLDSLVSDCGRRVGSQVRQGLFWYTGLVGGVIDEVCTGIVAGVPECIDAAHSVVEKMEDTVDKARYRAKAAYFIAQLPWKYDMETWNIMRGILQEEMPTQSRVFKRMNIFDRFCVSLDTLMNDSFFDSETPHYDAGQFTFTQHKSILTQCKELSAVAEAFALDSTKRAIEQTHTCFGMNAEQWPELYNPQIDTQWTKIYLKLIGRYAKKGIDAAEVYNQRQIRSTAEVFHLP